MFDALSYARKWQLSRYHTRRKKAIEFLGGKCVECGSRDELEFDHIIATHKKFTIASLWSIRKELFWKEVRKCQLLCKNCHKKKTLKDRGIEDPRNSHGTLSSYRYCKCELCKKAKRDWMRNYMRLRRSKGS